jgi:hypothetical protein
MSPSGISPIDLTINPCQAYNASSAVAAEDLNNPCPENHPHAADREEPRNGKRKAQDEMCYNEPKKLKLGDEAEIDEENPWSLSEYRVLMGTVENHRIGNRIDWEAVAKKVECKTAKQCQFKYIRSHEAKLRRLSKFEKGCLLYFGKRDQALAEKHGLQKQNLDYIHRKFVKYNLELNNITKERLGFDLSRYEKKPPDEQQNLIDTFLKVYPRLENKLPSGIEETKSTQSFFTEEEVSRLKEAILKQAGLKRKNWAKIAEYVKTKTLQQCRRKASNMKPNVKRRFRFSDLQIGSVIFFGKVSHDMPFILEKFNKYNDRKISLEQLSNVFYHRINKMTEIKKTEYEGKFLKYLKERLTEEEYNTLLLPKNDHENLRAADSEKTLLANDPVPSEEIVFEFTLEQGELFLKLGITHELNWEKISKDFNTQTQMHVSTEDCEKIHAAMMQLST